MLPSIGGADSQSPPQFLAASAIVSTSPAIIWASDGLISPAAMASSTAPSAAAARRVSLFLLALQFQYFARRPRKYRQAGFYLQGIFPSF
jgi:hypothetical protein